MLNYNFIKKTISVQPTNYLNYFLNKNIKLNTNVINYLTTTFSSVSDLFTNYKNLNTLQIEKNVSASIKQKLLSKNLNVNNLLQKSINDIILRNFFSYFFASKK